MANVVTRMLTFLLILVLALMQYQLWCGQGGIKDMWHLKRVIAIADIQNARMLEQNAVLFADVEDLRSGDEAVEERARNNIGMIRPGEHFYQIVHM